MYGSATILLDNPGSQRLVACGGRISTQRGSALEIFNAATDPEKNLRLIKKVLSSGHKSVLEHQSFGIAFDNVSVLTEQYIIECRLASFTVKSRRYVDFSNAGYIVPEGMSPEAEATYNEAVRGCFETYAQLLEMNIPMEDARFVLPYGFRSNFYCTMNARELLSLILSMLYGRGAAYPELKYLGDSLARQFDTLYPGVLAEEEKRARFEQSEQQTAEIQTGGVVKPLVQIVAQPTQPVELLDTALRFSNRFEGGFSQENMKALLTDVRPRELELLQYSFKIDNLSLACVTHFTRHRMLSLLLQHEYTALAKGNYVLPRSIAANAEATALYTKIFAVQAQAASTAKKAGAGIEQLSYFALAGHTTSILITMNARELRHFASLRCCNRAQWEIRGIACTMIEQLRATESEPIFRGYGPTCVVTGACPEGKMSCGRVNTLSK